MDELFNTDYGYGCITWSIIALVLTVLPIHWLMQGGAQYYTRHNGEHIGYITAVEQNTGPFFAYQNNTTTVYVKTDIVSAQENRYCISSTDSDLIAKARELAQNKTSVKVIYDEISFPRVGECGGDTIKDIQPLD